MLRRNIAQACLEVSADTPVLLINGSRQSGKSTFVKSVFHKSHQYFTLDDVSTLKSVQQDPVMFLEGVRGPIIIDEIQRAPELFLPIKKKVDEHRLPGSFILTGSANVLALPRMGDSLAGRMEIHTLWPFSQGEFNGIKEDFIQALFMDNFLEAMQQKPIHVIELEHLIAILCQGGYPETLSKKSPQRQQKWFASYMMMILEKDVRDLSHIEGLLEIPNLMQLMAARCGCLANTTEISRTLGISATTLRRYITILENLYLLISVPAWSKNLTKRLVKAPKTYLNDTGLLLHCIGANPQRLLRDKGFLGHVLENFVVMEFKKQMTWSAQPCRMFHFRTHEGQEVDIILEAPNGELIAIEVKLAYTVGSKDFSGMSCLEKDIGLSFHRGIVLYMGDQIIPFGKNKHAIPLSYLWDCVSK